MGHRAQSTQEHIRLSALQLDPDAALDPRTISCSSWSLHRNRLGPRLGQAWVLRRILLARVVLCRHKAPFEDIGVLLLPASAQRPLDVPRTSAVGVLYFEEQRD